MRTSTLLVLLAATFTASAQLAPTTPAPLSAHLQEVNKEWRRMDPAPTAGDNMVRFDNDAMRIARHLHMVREQLMAQMPEGLGPDQAQARKDLLDALDHYADRGLFPQNHVLPYRNPIFIDPHHTACAVGQLMIESGSAALAELISSEMNQAYVHDMTWPEIGQWAGTNGFTADELAWIQPAYSPTHDWFGLGGGTNGAVTAMHELSNGNLLVAGDFTLAGTTYAQQVAAWLGSSYQGYGGGVEGYVTCAVEFNGLLYLGGSFSSGYSDLAVWNGSTWSYQNAFNGKYVRVNDLRVFEGELCAAGYASGFAGNTYQVLKLTGTNWLPVGDAFNDAVLALDELDGILVCGGAFTQLFSIVDPLALHVAQFNGGSWLQLSDGLDATVRDLQMFNGQLYAGGDMRVDSVPTFGLARIGAGAITWEPLMPNHWGYANYFNGEEHIASMAVASNELYIGGAFSISGMMNYGVNVARFGSIADMFEPMAMADGKVNKLAAFNDLLVMGGEFQNNDASVTPFVAYTELSIGIDEPASGASFTVMPNPAIDELVIDLARDPAPGSTIDVLDVAGRNVNAAVHPRERHTRIDVRGLSAGSYWLRVQDNGTSSIAPFVKH